MRGAAAIGPNRLLGVYCTRTTLVAQSKTQQRPNFSSYTDVPKPMSQTSPGYSPPLIKQKKILSAWVQKWTGSEISTYVHVRVSFEYYIRRSNECGNEFASFPQTLRYARNCSATWKSTIRKCFLIQTPCLVHCHWHNHRRSECLPSQQTCSLWPPSWIKYKYPFQLFQVEYI